MDYNIRNWYKSRFGIIGSVFFVATCLLLMTGCNPLQGTATEKIINYEKNFEIVGSEKDELIGKVNPEIFFTANRSNEGLEQVGHNVYTKEGVKVNLQEGRYLITGQPAGNIFIYDENGNLVIREVVGYGGVASLSVDIKDSYTIFADGGYDYVNFTPLSTLPSTELTAGIWEVGLDIEAGEYIVSNDNGLGYLEVHEKGKEPILYEIIGGSQISQSTSRVSLIDGQKLRVTKISKVLFTPVED
ncbi:hypothetical protein [Sporosarcina highlanderae]|uniref:Lipoprotein n=1 Tax=Sporosarcina highlanderae TaxID=3035916 RepID=A0ABT8JPJ7_9BACL|nr:hypothetical protein [Sporosarcina highlanderae]MDN4606892.1 hypothetical protein [Sporosarcina highlanderae]